MKTFTNSHGCVTVLEFQSAFFGNTACYYVVARGDVEAYFAPGGTSTIHHVEELPDGTWRAWYEPDDDNFKEYRASLLAINAWERA